MHVKANIRRHTGNARHLVHGRESQSIATEIVRVEIESADGSFLLRYFDAKEVCVADTWHATLEQAKLQAQFEFEIEEADWSAVA